MIRIISIFLKKKKRKKIYIYNFNLRESLYVLANYLNKKGNRILGKGAYTSKCLKLFGTVGKTVRPVPSNVEGVVGFSSLRKLGKRYFQTWYEWRGGAKIANYCGGRVPPRGRKIEEGRGRKGARHKAPEIRLILSPFRELKRSWCSGNDIFVSGQNRIDLVTGETWEPGYISPLTPFFHPFYSLYIQLGKRSSLSKIFTSWSKMFHLMKYLKSSGESMVDRWMNLWFLCHLFSGKEGKRKIKNCK